MCPLTQSSPRASQAQLYRSYQNLQDSKDTLAPVLPPALPCLSLSGPRSFPASLAELVHCCSMKCSHSEYWDSKSAHWLIQNLHTMPFFFQHSLLSILRNSISIVILKELMAHHHDHFFSILLHHSKVGIAFKWYLQSQWLSALPHLWSLHTVSCLTAATDMSMSVALHEGSYVCCLFYWQSHLWPTEISASGLTGRKHISKRPHSPFLSE